MEAECYEATHGYHLFLGECLVFWTIWKSVVKIRCMDTFECYWFGVWILFETVIWSICRQKNNLFVS